jgi:hypothetical protein
MSWKPEVKVDNSGKWSSNAVILETKKEAEAYVYDLMMRWALVWDTRVIEVDYPVNYRWAYKGLEAIPTVGKAS